MQVLSFRNVNKFFDNQPDVGLHGVSLSVQQGEFLALAGPSGSGKTTLLNIAAGLDFQSDGDVILLNQNLKSIGPEGVLNLRRTEIGFIFQSYNLFPVLNVLENVEYPLALNAVPAKERRTKALQMLKEVGLEGLEKRKPSELSGGQQQRVAIARAMVGQPRVIFADEPTANLDAGTAEKLLALFRRLNRMSRVTFIFSSHDPRVLKMADRVVQLSDGVILSDQENLNNCSKSTRDLNYYRQ